MSTVITSDKPSAGWGLRHLNDGREIPEVAFGSWQAQDRSDIPVEDQVSLALDKGFIHIDTAQTYRYVGQEGSAARAEPARAGSGEAEEGRSSDLGLMVGLRICRNEAEVGQAIKDFDGPKPWVTTKWSGTDDKGVWQSLDESLAKVSRSSVARRPPPRLNRPSLTGS